MGAQLVDGVPFPLEFLLREEAVKLRVAGAADADGLLDRRAIKLASVSFVGMTGARDEVMAGERLVATADGAWSVHKASWPRCGAGAR